MSKGVKVVLVWGSREVKEWMGTPPDVGEVIEFTGTANYVVRGRVWEVDEGAEGVTCNVKVERLDGGARYEW